MVQRKKPVNALIAGFMQIVIKENANNF